MKCYYTILLQSIYLIYYTCIYLIISSHLTLSSAILIPQLRSGSTSALHCPTGLSAHGWLLFKYKAGISIEPTSDKIGLLVSNKQIVILKFCSSSDITLPQGGYCVLKGSANCPEYFTQHVLSEELLKNYDYVTSDNFGDAVLCCADEVNSTITMPITPPFALVKKGTKCQDIKYTHVSEISLTNDYNTLIKFCYYEVDISCTHCQQTCIRKNYGAICSCYHGYKLLNNSHCQGVDTCNYNNGGCDHVCSYDNESHITCSCNHGYSLYDNTMCLPNAKAANAKPQADRLMGCSGSDTFNTTANPALFSTARDYTIMTITVGVLLVITLLVFCLLLKLNCLVCTTKCTTCPDTCRSSCSYRPCPSVVKRSSPRRRVSSSFNRNSISAPHVGNVAVDLLNRPKQNVSTMHDLPSSMARVSYYTNTDTCSRQGSRHGNPDTCSRHGNPDTTSHKTESIYDSLDRRQHNLVAISTQNSVQYDEPDSCTEPLVARRTDQYYCEPDEEAPATPPETPLPAYSPCLLSPPETPLPAYSPGIYNFSQTYQDPGTKFAVGTLGRKSACDEGSTRVASVAPTLRVQSCNVEAKKLKENGS